MIKLYCYKLIWSGETLAYRTPEGDVYFYHPKYRSWDLSGFSSYRSLPKDVFEYLGSI